MSKKYERGDKGVEGKYYVKKIGNRGVKGSPGERGVMRRTWLSDIGVKGSPGERGIMRRTWLSDISYSLRICACSFIFYLICRK